MSRLTRKYHEIRTWLDSVQGPADWPAAFVLALFRTRPAKGGGFSARTARSIFPYLWIRPKMLRGLALRMNPAHLSDFVIYEEVFINGAYNLKLLAFEPDAVVDCGAFEGYFSMLARAHFPSAPIVAFEPNAKNFAVLQANVQRNHLTMDLREAAVSTRDGEAFFEGSGCGGHLAEAGQPNLVRVTVTDLRRVLKELSPKRLLLKMDVEGEEITLLPELLPLLPHQCALFFEWHHGNDTYRTFTELLGQHGFMTSKTRQHRADERVIYIDAFAQRN